jgi:hypothetical protein
MAANCPSFEPPEVAKGIPERCWRTCGRCGPPNSINLAVPFLCALLELAAPIFYRSDHLRRSVDLSFPSRLQLNLRLFTGCNRAKHSAGGRGGDADIPKNGRRRATQNPPGSFAAAPGEWNLSLPRPSGSELTDLAHHENGTTGSAISTFRIFSLPK